MRCGKLWGMAESAIYLIKGAAEHFKGYGYILLCYILFPGLHGHFLLDRLYNLIPGCNKIFFVFLPCLCHPCQYFNKPGHAHTPSFRKICSCVKRLLFRRHYNGQGPAPLTGQCLAYRHVYMIDVRPFLPIHLYGYKILIQDIGNFPVLKGFPLHDMTPMASGIAYG